MSTDENYGDANFAKHSIPKPKRVKHRVPERIRALCIGGCGRQVLLSRWMGYNNGGYNKNLCRKCNKIAEHKKLKAKKRA
jgi:hypothetical protein